MTAEAFDVIKAGKGFFDLTRWAKDGASWLRGAMLAVVALILWNFFFPAKQEVPAAPPISNVSGGHIETNPKTEIHVTENNWPLSRLLDILPRRTTTAKRAE